MDLGAYADIDKLKKIAEANGIAVPSLRGYRLMKDEEPIPQDELDRDLNDLVGTYWWMYDDRNPEWFDHTREDYCAGYRPPSIPRTPWGSYPFFMEIGMLKARFKRQYMLWNRYAGQENVLYIHSRVGGRGIAYRDYYDEQGGVEFPEGWDVRDQPWFLDVCADAFDPTYCDIYARIEECD